MKSKLAKAFSHTPKIDKVINYLLILKDEILDFVFWCRQIIALIFGLSAGIMGFTGIYVIVSFFVALFLLSYVYYTKILKINEEDFG